MSPIFLRYVPGPPTDDLYRVLSEPTPKAERDAVIRAAWREHRTAQVRRFLSCAAIVLGSIAFVLVAGFFLAWLAY